MSNRDTAKTDALQGTLDLIVLQGVERTAWERMVAIMHTVLGEST